MNSIDFTLPDEVTFIGDIINTVANASITFNSVIPHSPSSVDIIYLPDGNAYVPPPEMQLITISCYLREVSYSSAQLETNFGVDMQSNYFEGRLINPKTYPMPIQAQGDIMANINGQIGRVVSHRAFSSPSAKNFGYDPVLGQKIALFVQFQQGVSS